MRAAAVALSVCLLLSGCRKKSAREYYRLESDYSVLVSRDGDAAYDEPELATIVDGLNAIPTDALERPKAEALLATIAAETLRAHKDRPAPPPVAAPTGNADALFAGLQQQRQDQAAAVAAALDASVKYTEPVKGMSEADFVKAFGDCFEKGENTTLPDGVLASSQRVKDLTMCQTKWGNALWVFGAQGLIGKLVNTAAASSSTETRVVDAGKPAPPAPPPETGIQIPGKPSGTGAAATPPPSVDDKQYLNDTPPPTVTPPAP